VLAHCCSCYFKACAALTLACWRQAEQPAPAFSCAALQQQRKPRRQQQVKCVACTKQLRTQHALVPVLCAAGKGCFHMVRGTSAAASAVIRCARLPKPDNTVVLLVVLMPPSDSLHACLCPAPVLHSLPQCAEAEAVLVPPSPSPHACLVSPLSPAVLHSFLQCAEAEKKTAGGVLLPLPHSPLACRCPAAVASLPVLC
jgi:hypothetical protein